MRLKNLERFRTGGTGNRLDLSLPIAKTPNGRVYQYSPNEKALPRHFVLGNFDEAFVITDAARKRMKLEPRSDRTVCPYSGTVADNDDFLHPEDAKAVEETLAHAIEADVDELFHGMFRDLERQLSSSKFVKVKAGPKPIPKPRPRFARWDLLRELACDHCSRDYGVFAIGLFCPDCGAPNLRLHFAREAQIVSQQIDIAEAQNDREELAYRLMGNAHEDVLTAFEAAQKTVYLYGRELVGNQQTDARPVRNDFQNVDRARRRFSDLGFDPYSSLADRELELLGLNIQKRHIIGHNLGIMDEMFADRSADARVGETVHLVGEDIRQFSDLAQRVVDRLDTWLAAGAAAPASFPSATATQEGTDVLRAPQPVKIQPDLGLGPLATRLAEWIVTTSENGLRDIVDDDALMAAFSDVEETQMEEAIAELKIDGYITTEGYLNSLPTVWAELELFATFDPILSVGNPVADSLIVANIVLNGEESVGVQELHQQTGWSLRRFNPAAALVIAHVDPRRVSQECQNEYPARFFFVAAEDRVALKRYTAKLSKS